MTSCTIFVASSFVISCTIFSMCCIFASTVAICSCVCWSVFLLRILSIAFLALSVYSFSFVLNISPMSISHQTILACPAATKVEDSIDSIGSGNHNRKFHVWIPNRHNPHHKRDRADHNPYSFLCATDNFSHHNVRPISDSTPIFALPGPQGIRLAQCESAFRPVLAIWTALYLLFKGSSSFGVFMISGFSCCTMFFISSVEVLSDWDDVRSIWVRQLCL